MLRISTFIFPLKFLKMENLPNKLNIEYLEHIETCQKLGYCRLKAKKKKCSSYKKPINQIELPFE